MKTAWCIYTTVREDNVFDSSRHSVFRMKCIFCAAKLFRRPPVMQMLLQQRHSGATLLEKMIL